MSEQICYNQQNSEERKNSPIPKIKLNPNFIKRINLKQINKSKLPNISNSLEHTSLNRSSIINRKDILSSFNQNLLKEAWIQLCNYVYKNYSTGKGTYIKGLGTFTFLDPEINLEGTTNQYKRDLKKRRPVFLVSKELYEFIRPGIFSKTNGLMPFVQKNYNKINIKIFNYNEIAIALNISKDECFEIIKNIICEMGEQISNNKYFSRELPGIGVMVIKDNICGVKFNDDFIDEISDKTEKLILLKKTMSINTGGYKYDPNKCLGNINIEDNSIPELIAKVSPITHITKEAEDWLEKSMKIKSSDYDNEEETKQTFNKVENNNPNNEWNSQNFFEAKENLTNKKQNSFNKNFYCLRNLHPEIQKAIISNKGQILREIKDYDRNINGFVTRFEVVRALNKCNIHPRLTMEIINDIISPYIKDQDAVDYKKLLTIIIKEIKHNLKNNPLYRNEREHLFNSFNNKFKFGPLDKNEIFNDDKIKKTNCTVLRKVSNKTKNFFKESEIKILEDHNENNFNYDEYNNMRVKISEVENEILSIKLILEDAINYKKNLMNYLKYEKFLNNDKEINYFDFMELLKAYSITYPEEKILKILKFVNIPNPQKMTLNIINKQFKECKITSSEMTDLEIEEALNCILFNNQLDLKNILFSSKREITQNDFVYLLHDKTVFSDNILQVIFQKLSNKNVYLSYDTLLNVTNNHRNEIGNTLNDNFYIASCKKILSKINALKITIDKYFMKLLRYNFMRKNNTLDRVDFVLAMEKEEYEPPFTERELNYIYDRMKNNKIGDLDRNEFKKAIIKEYNALRQIQDFIKKMKLTLEDIIFRMNISPDDYSKNINFWEFKLKIKKIDSDYSNEFIESLYIELVGDLDNNINIQYLLDSLNVYQQNDFLKINNESFVKNFISNIRNKVDYHTLKSSFEQIDINFSGKISKSKFCSVISTFTKEFPEEDILKLIRITKISEDPTSEVDYIKFINIVYYEPNLDAFLLAVNELNEVFIIEANKDLNKLISIVNGEKNEINDINNNYLTIENLYSYLIDRINKKNKNTYIKINEPITMSIISKFDVDCDGKISLEDLKTVLERYINTDFFKYENDSKDININLFSNQILSDKEFRALVRKIKENMKKKKLSEIGLFKLLDENKDGFISNYEFNKNIKEIVELNPSMKDRFFNYLDGYKNGMIDLNTFLSRFKEFKLDNVMENNVIVENCILERLSEYIWKNLYKLKDSEIFCLMDKDRDGIISIEDFKSFVINELGIFKSQINDYKLERVMQVISLSKNLNITLADITEFINKLILNKKQNSYYIDLKEIFKETNNMNLSKDKKNQDWIIELIEKLGLYISQKYENVTNFFNINANLEENKLRFEDFTKFLDKNLECFEGFNLSKDEIVSVFTSLDSQKKKYLTLEDLKNKLDIFDFYKKMHFDIINFLHNNFQNYIEAFNFFLNDERTNLSACKTNRPNSENKSNEYYSKTAKPNNKNKNNKGLTLKQFYDGINNMFPGKYSNENLLKYIKKYFNLDAEEESSNNKEKKLISFSQFIYIYYEIVLSYEEYIKSKNRSKFNKIITTRNSIIKSFSKKFDIIHKNNSTGNMMNKFNIFKNEKEHSINHLQKITSKFDNDPLYKIKRIISSSPNTNFSHNIRNFMNKFKDKNYICNEHQFKNLIRELNIGISNLEIDEIIKRNGRSYNGMINIKNFYKYVIGKDKLKIKIEDNISIILSEIKQLLYKYYSNPKLAFIFNDKDQMNKIDFNKFKSMIIELYTKENKQIPNFVILKNCYDYIDLRKDGILDIVEWCNVFSKVSGQLDLFKGLENKKGFKELKKWEMGEDIINLYKNIYKNRKMISLRAKNVCFGYFIHEDSLINILKEYFPDYKLTNAQWKIIVEIGTKNSKGFINFENFMNVIENCTKRKN